MKTNSLKINGQLCDSSQLRNKNFIRSLTGDDAFASFLEEWFDEKDYVIGYTSGSTGTPKPIRLRKEAMRASARRTNAFFKMGEGSSILLCLSTNYIAGKMMVVRALEGNVDLWVEKPSSLPRLEGKFDLVSLVPMQVYSLRMASDGVQRLQNVRNLLVGGAPLMPEDAQWLLAHNVQTFVSYGMTETVSHVALASLNENKADGSLVYHALPSLTFEQDERDCLVIKADYLDESPLITNDVVELLSPTAFVWLGRWDNVINTGGVKVHPEIMERKIASIIPSLFYFTSEPDAKFGQRVILKIEGTPCSTDALMEELSKALSPYEMPKEIRFIEKFEKTTTGKLKRM